jgi:2-iminobutanoate/2-iminopropanoate deaminase
MKSIFEVGNLKSNGHYALATIHNDTVYVSGQFSIDPVIREKKFGTPVKTLPLQHKKQ